MPKRLSNSARGPQDEEGKHRGEGHRPGGLGPPDEQVEDEEDPVTRTLQPVSLQ